MADWSEEVQESAPVVAAEIIDIKLFGRWSSADVEVKDIGLQDYIAVKVRTCKLCMFVSLRKEANRKCAHAIQSYET